MDQSFQIRKFAFDRIFAVQDAADAIKVEDLQLEIAALKAEAALMQQEHEAALALARADAFEAGLAQARSEREAALLAATDALHASVEDLDTRFDEICTRHAGDAAEVALAAADLLAGRALALDPTAAIDEAIGRVLRQVARGRELIVRVHPDLVEDIERLIAARQSQDRRKLNLHVVADPSMALGDAAIIWDQGGLALDFEARRAEILAELETLLPAPVSPDQD